MFKKVAFTYYPVTDVARARKFYEETLGLKSSWTLVLFTWTLVQYPQGDAAIRPNFSLCST